MEQTRSDILIELGRRLALRRSEAGLDLPTLAKRATVDESSIERFERGGGGLASGGLSRIASVLGIPLGGLLSASATAVSAPKQTAPLLFSRRLAELSEVDQAAVSVALERARNLVTLDQILHKPTLKRGWGVSEAPDREAHLEGYRRADEVRNELSNDIPIDSPLKDLRRVIEDRFAILVRETTFASHKILGTSCRSGSARIILVAASIAHDSDLRLAMAHELAHHLMDLEGDSGLVDSSEEDLLDAPLTGGFSLESPPQEQRAKAFAIRFLAPPSAVRRVVGAPTKVSSIEEGREMVRSVRHDLGIGFDAAAWHLFNLKYFKSREVVEALLRNPDRDEILSFENRSTLDGLERRAREALFADEISEARYRSLLGLPYDALLS